MTDRLTGIVTPLLTPYGTDGAIAHDLMQDHAQWCLAQGVHYLSPFGTTGEATSNSLSERMAALDALIDSGIPAARLMPGTGVCALAETVALTRHAARAGVSAAMVLPPFFYPADDAGLFRYYSTLIEHLGADCPQLILYHIPQNTGVAISPALAARLAAAFPGIVAAYKDSSGDWENTVAVIDAAPDIAVFPASETLLARALPLGAAGCISASCNTNPAAIRACYDALLAGDDEKAGALQPRLETHRTAVVEAGLIGALKSLTAQLTGDDRWLNTRAPLLPAEERIGTALIGTVGAG